MKHQWVADSADFGKHGLLRALSNPDPPDEYLPLKLGVVWYLTPDDDDKEPKKPKTAKNAKNGNNPHAYLSLQGDEARAYEDSDPTLYHKLRHIYRTNPGRLDVGRVERSGILPEGTAFYSALVPEKLGRETRERRREWVEGAQKKVKGCDLVFLDPDNGLDPKAGGPNKKPNQRPTIDARHVRLDEIRPYMERGQSVILYQTSAMKGAMIRQVWEKRCVLERELGIRPFAMVYARHKDGWVFFLVISQPEHRERLVARARGMINGGWDQHFIMRAGTPPTPNGVQA